MLMRVVCSVCGLMSLMWQLFKAKWWTSHSGGCRLADTLTYSNVFTAKLTQTTFANVWYLWISWLIIDKSAPKSTDNSSSTNVCHNSLINYYLIFFVLMQKKKKSVLSCLQIPIIDEPLCPIYCSICLFDLSTATNDYCIVRFSNYSL